MLVLTRKVGEAIAIGDDIKVIIMQIKGKQVRIGIKAGPETVVHREEIFQKIQGENQLASKAETKAVDEAANVLENRGNEGSMKTPFRRYTRRPKGDSNDS